MISLIVNFIIDIIHFFIMWSNYSKENSCIFVASKNIYKIVDLSNFTSVKYLKLMVNNITEIEGLDNLINLEIIDAYRNKITKIKGLDNLVNLHTLNLSYNEITEIDGLNKLTNLHILSLCKNNINKIDGLNKLNNLKYLLLNYNNIKEINELDNLNNLEKLYLNNNQISKIKGINHLNNLDELDLSYNLITNIKELNQLTNLTILRLNNNQITEIQNIQSLTNLKELHLYNNQITKIQNIQTLTNLKELYLHNNQITELPLSLCNLRNLKRFFYHGNPIEYIPLPVQRWLNRINNRVTDNIMVYNDGQNIHNNYIQTSFRQSLENILRDKNLLSIDTVKAEILNNDVLTEQTKMEILNYCDDNTVHTTYLITYADLLTYIWSRISKSVNKPDLCKVLNQEISDGLCMCFTGRMTRLLNCLSGFYNDIELQISDSEQITNIIVALKKKYNGEQLVEKVKAEMLDRNYSNDIIDEWLGYL